MIVFSRSVFGVKCRSEFKRKSNCDFICFKEIIRSFSTMVIALVGMTEPPWADGSNLIHRILENHFMTFYR